MTLADAWSRLRSRLPSGPEPDGGEARRGYRSLFALAALVVGTLAADALAARAGWTNSAAWFGAAAITLAVASATRGRSCKVALWLGVVFLSAGWFDARVCELPANAIERRLDTGPLAEPALIRVEGLALDWPEAVAPRGEFARYARSTPGSSIDLRVWRVEESEGDWSPASGTLRVRVDVPPDRLAQAAAPGTILRITGRITPVRSALNPGEPDWVMLAHQEAQAGSLHAPSLDLLEPGVAATTLERATALAQTILGRAHSFAATTLRANSTAAAPAVETQPDDPSPTRREQARALLGAMLLGERSAALAPVNAAFTRLGLIHLVAISGFNLVVMAGVAMFILRLGGERGWLEPVGVGVLILLYMLVLPMQAPIMRAGVTALVFLVAEAAGRRYDRITLLGWVAIGALVLRPLDLFSPGFQLSFGVVGALLVLGDRVRDRLFLPEIRGVLRPSVAAGPVGIRATLAGVRAWTSSALKAQISASVLAWCVATPIIAFHTGLVSPLAVLTTMVVLPLTVVVLWAGYTAMLVGALCPPAAGAAAGVLDILGTLLVDIVMLLDRIPVASFRLPRLSVGLAIACVALAVYWLWRARRREALAWAASAAVALWFAFEIVLGPRLAVRGVCRLDTLSVGDGSCHLVRASRGLLGDPETLLWDCGSLTTSLGERRIPDTIRALGARRVDTIVVTHAHIDHFSAIPDVVDALGVRRVIVSPQLLRAANGRTSGPLALFMGRLRDKGLEVRVVSQGDAMALGGGAASFLWPPPDRDFKDPNDASLVARIDFPTGAGERRILLTGDISREAVPSLLPDPAQPNAGPSLRADVLEIPHHGAFLEPGVELVRVVAPAVVVQSTGPDRARDRRWDASKKDRDWLVSCVHGAGSVTIDAHGRVVATPFIRGIR